MAWLRLPPAGRDGRVAVLPSAGGHCTEVTINRKLPAVSAFYQHSARNGVQLGCSEADLSRLSHRLTGRYRTRADGLDI